ncbi:creatinine amidohydrolase [Geoalkalibacter ferrihydriticus]|uniref:Creatinine amidohydrolase n=2 Tax=Geoalkalibacter ferrihydriticus TaxID=392333 RepID=A0A0C2HRB8_9BACT|nr:creatininase family protein [Geoalkalibacter ferrihydriticus]KIH77410.1 creatinine amidohydrolase [Geoalkalibacter ferrihydriticus DSM 17813]SDM16241.1 creatinine amidohydrolase [Geoalkalibacter ferrihydriticus]
MILSEITMPEFEKGLKRTRTVLIPFGVVEQHGDHLPLGTDTMQAEDVCLKLAQRRAVFVAPPIHYGVCRSTADHPGTISISTETLKALTVDIVSDLYRNGLRCFVLISGHAGGTHNATLLDAGEVLLKKLPEAQIAVVTEYDLAVGEGGDIIETSGDAHAGEIETSRILHARPHLVKGRGRAEVPTFPQAILVRDKRRYWPGGVHGDPTKASADKGRRIEALVVDALERLVLKLEQARD